MIQIKLRNEMIEDVMMEVFPGQNICFFIEAVALNEIKKITSSMKDHLEQKKLFNYSVFAKVIHIESEFNRTHTNTAVVESQKHRFFLRYDPKKTDIQKGEYLFFEASLVINSYELGSLFYLSEGLDDTLYDNKQIRLARLCQMYNVLAVHRYLYIEKQKKYLIEEVEESRLTGPDDLSDFILTVENTHLSAYEVLKEQHKLYGGIDIAKFNF